MNGRSFWWMQRIACMMVLSMVVSLVPPPAVQARAVRVAAPQGGQAALASTGEAALTAMQVDPDSDHELRPRPSTILTTPEVIQTWRISATSTSLSDGITVLRINHTKSSKADFPYEFPDNGCYYVQGALHSTASAGNTGSYYVVPEEGGSFLVTKATGAGDPADLLLANSPSVDSVIDPFSDSVDLYGQTDRVSRWLAQGHIVVQQLTSIPGSHYPGVNCAPVGPYDPLRGDGGGGPTSDPDGCQNLGNAQGDADQADAVAGGASVGDPISLLDGSWYLTIPCFHLGGAGVPMNVGLGYSTRQWQDRAATNVLGSAGRGWTVSYSRNITGDDLQALIQMEDGGTLAYTRTYQTTSTNYYTPPPGTGNFTDLERDRSSGVWRLIYRNRTVDTFDSTGALTSITDRLGNRITITSDTTARIKTLRNERTGQTVVLRHTQVLDPDLNLSVWRLSSIEDGATNGGTVRQTTLTYVNGRVAQITTLGGHIHGFAYDSLGRVSTYTNPNGGTAQNTYATTTGRTYRVTKQTLSNGTTINLNWITGNSSYDLQVIYNQGTADQRVVSYLHATYTTGESRGFLARIYNPTTTTSFNSSTPYVSNTYNAYGQLTETTDQVGRVTKYSYNTSTADLISVVKMVSSSGGDAINMEYDGYGNLTYLQEPAGAVTRWTYTVTATLETVRRETGTGSQTTTFTANSAGQPTKMRLPDGTTYTYTYDTRGYPDVTTYGLGVSENADYDWRGFLIGWTDRQGIRSKFEYDNQGWLTASVRDTGTGGRAIRTTYTYDHLGNPTQIVVDQGTGKLNATTALTYASAGARSAYLLKTLTNPENQVTTFGYTPLGELKTVTDALNHTTTFAYTTEGWLKSVLLHDGRTAQSRTYFADGQVNVEIDGRGVKTEYSYNAKGLVSQIKVGTVLIGSWPIINNAFTLVYDKNDRLKSLYPTNNPAWSINRTYDTYNRLASETKYGVETIYTYDPNRNWLTKITQGSTNTTQQIQTQYNHDVLGRVTSEIIDPGTGRKNLTTVYRYTTTGSSDPWNVQEVVDPVAYAINPAAPPYKTIYRYNSLGLLGSTTDAKGNTWSYTYNNLGSLSRIADPRGNSYDTTYTLDKLGRAIQSNRGGRSEAWSYNADGSLNTTTDLAGRITKYSYDPTARIVGIDYGYLAAAPANDVTLSYFGNDLLQTASSKPDGNTTETTTYDYDAANRFAKRTRPVGGTNRTVGYGYNALNQIATINYWGNGTVSYTPNYRGLLESVNPWGAGESLYSYRSTGTLSSIQRAAPNDVTTDYTYDTAGRLTNLDHTKYGIVLQAMTYGYNNSQRTTSSEQIGLANWGTTTFTYDELNRLTSVSYPAIPNGPVAQTEAHAYDAVGNRLTPGAEKLWIDNFEDGDGAGWTPTGGNWSIVTEGGSRAYKKIGTDSQAARTGEPTWTNYAVQANVTITRDAANTNAAIRGRVQNATSFYQLALGNNGTAGKAWSLQKSVNGTVTTLASGSSFYSLNTASTLRLEFAGSTITALISTNNGSTFQTLGSVNDTALANGNIALASWGTDVRFDDVSVLVSPRFSDTFEDGNSTGWTLTGGTWNVGTIGGSLALIKTGTDTQAARAGDPTWTDYSIQAKMIITRDAANTNAAIRGRVQSATSFYQLALGNNGTAGQAWSLQKSVNGTITTLSSGSTTYTLNTASILRLEFAGKLVIAQVSANGGSSFQTLATVTDAALSSGNVALSSWGTDVAFDQVTVAPMDLRFTTLDQIANTGFVYDTAGNLTATPDGTTYVYDQANQLTRMVKNGITTDYLYDALGNLIRQKVNGVTTDFILDEAAPNPRLLGSVTGSTTTLYAYGPEGLHAQKQVGGSIVYPLGDGLGSVRALSDSNGNLSRATSYDAWGLVRAVTGTAPASALGFTGEQQSSDGLVYLRARMYQPSLGRFLQRDTFPGFATRPQSLNRYAYVEGNPVNWVDPSGFTTEPGGFGIDPKASVDTVKAATDILNNTIDPGHAPASATMQEAAKLTLGVAKDEYAKVDLNNPRAIEQAQRRVRFVRQQLLNEGRLLANEVGDYARQSHWTAPIRNRLRPLIQRASASNILSPRTWWRWANADIPHTPRLPPSVRRLLPILPVAGGIYTIATDPANATACGFRITPASLVTVALGEIPIIGDIFVPETTSLASLDELGIPRP